MSKHKALAAVAFSVLAVCAAARAGQGVPIVIDNPNPADYSLNPGEQLLMVIPSPEPPARSPAPAAAPPAGGYPYRALMRGGSPAPSAAGLAPAAAPRRTGKTEPVAEVANETSRRTRGAPPEPTKGEERVPWWKGGLWRNPGDTGGDDADPVAARRSGGAGRAAPRDPEADLWGDEGGYTGYNPDGSFGRPTPPPPPQPGYGDPYATGTGVYDPYAPPPQPGYPPPQAGYDPYAPPPPYADPYAPQPYAQQPYVPQGGYVSPPFTDPNAPLGAYVDPNLGAAPYAAPYVDPYAAGPAVTQYGAGVYDTSAYGTVPAIDASTGQMITPYPVAPAYPAAPYAPAPEDPYASPAPQAPASVPGAQGGPQFENAVRMVKENRFTEAKAILGYETVRNPANAAAWRWLADCHYNLLELDDAIRCYQRSLELDQGDYYALRGQGFSYLHRGHEYWRRMQEEVARSRKEEAASTFSLAHDDYKRALEMLGLCLRRAPNDGEAIYGEAMAAEGASRKLYSNAISYLKLGPEQRERAELFAENCLTVINKGIERSRERSRQEPGDSGPRALLGGLYLRKATLYHQLGRNDQALIELRNARDVQRSILDEIDKNNATAQRALQEAESLWEQWGGGR